jgi:glycosyltransferase involved in cell wall biosynthesis
MHLLYIATNFGSLTNTFIAREVSALRRRGHRVDLLALRRTNRSIAAEPECDLSECRFVFPINWPVLVWLSLRYAVTRPRRWWRAVSVVVRAPGDSWRTRLKLFGQLLVATTAVPGVERLAPELIHAHLANPPGSYALFISLLSGIPFTFTAHAADLFRKPVGTVVKLREAAGVVAISMHNLRHYRDLYPELQRAAVIHCGVRPAEFPYRRRQRSEGPLRLLAVGRAVAKKGFAVLLQAVADLDPARYPWQAHIVGDGPLLGQLRALQRELGLDRLEFTGPLQQAQIRDLLEQADIFCLPCVVAPDGDVDGIPVSLMEAMAAGCPVVSTRVSGIPELLADGRAGLLVPPDDAAALASALRRFGDEPELAAVLSARGRARIEQDFDLDREAARLERFFAGVLAGRLPPDLISRDTGYPISER